MQLSVAFFWSAKMSLFFIPVLGLMSSPQHTGDI